MTESEAIATHQNHLDLINNRRLIHCERHRRIIHNLRKELEKGNLLTVAFRKAGIKSSQTFYAWMNKSERLRKFVYACQEKAQETRNAMVEDAQFKRLIESKAGGAEYEFYLCNRIPDRWKKLKDNSVVVQNTINNEATQSGNTGAFDGEDVELVSDIRAKLFPNLSGK